MLFTDGPLGRVSSHTNSTAAPISAASVANSQLRAALSSETAVSYRSSLIGSV